MNCGEITTSIAPRDFFQPAFVQEWIDGALEGEDLDKWISLDMKALADARHSAKTSTNPQPTDAANKQKQN